MEASSSARSSGGAGSAGSATGSDGVGNGAVRDTISWKRIVDTLMQNNAAWPFKQPVDPEGDGVPDYYEIIKTPMDLSTVQEKVDTYPTFDDFVRDVNLVWQNCYTYNGKDHPISKNAQTLERVFNTWAKNQEAKKKPGGESSGGKSARKWASSRVRRTADQRLRTLDETTEKICRKWMSAGIDSNKIWVPEQQDLHELENCIAALPTRYLNGAVEIILNGCPEALREKTAEAEMLFRACHLNHLTWSALMSYVYSCMLHMKSPANFAGLPRPHAFIDLARLESMPATDAVLEITPFVTLLELRESMGHGVASLAGDAGDDDGEDEAGSADMDVDGEEGVAQAA